MEELKRLNNIHRENEIFARSILKVPITPHTILLGAIPEVHQCSGSNSPKSTPIANNNENLLINPQELKDRLSIAQPSVLASDSSESNGGNAITVNEVIFNSALVPNEQNHCDSNEELTEQENVKTLQSFLNLNGIDCGIKWYHLIIVVLLLVSIPIYVYFFYKDEKHEKHSN